MYCARCTGEWDGEAARCVLCGADPLLEGRYRLEGVIGRGGSGVTWRATRVDDGHRVCVKELHYLRMQSFETERLFAREARVLRQLDHPGIPDYVDDFATGTGRSAALYLVQELVEGQSLAAELDGRRYTEDEVLAIGEELLGILVYLHGLSPPVLHRDIKPDNVLRRSSDGRLVLVDFGAVRDVMRDASGTGSTVVGTFGYMPPEQLQGRAAEASDIYGVGVLMTHLLSRREPLSMMDPHHRLDWRPHVRVGPETARLLASMVEPDVARRATSAAEVREHVRLAREALSSPRPPAALPRHASRDREPPPRPAAMFAPEPSTPADDGNVTTTDHGDHGAVRGGLAMAIGLVVMVAALLSAAALSGERQVRTFATGTTATDTAERRSLEPPAAVSLEAGVKGLRLGMSRTEAEAALPELASAEDVGPERVSEGRMGDLLAAAGVDLPALPGTRLRARTTLLGYPAELEAAFFPDLGLVRVTLTMADALEMAPHEAREAALSEELTARFGPPARWLPWRDDPMGRHRYRHANGWVWRDGGDTLTVETGHIGSGFVGSFDAAARVRVELVSGHHQEERGRAQAAAREQRVARERARAERAARELERERERIRASGGDPAHDL